MYRKNKILFNGLIFAPDGTGISRYVENLVKQFLENKYNVDVVLRGCFKEKFIDNDNIIFVDNEIKNTTHRIIVEQWQLRDLYKEYGTIHFPDYASPVFTTTNTVSTIHDLSMVTMRRYRTFKQNVVKNLLLQNTRLRGKVLICDSHFTKSELIKIFPDLADKSSVIHLGVDTPSINADDYIIEKLSLVPYEYLLYVGTLAPHKNIVKLIESFGILVKQGYLGKLVIAGGKGWMYEEIFDVVKKLKMDKHVLFTGYIEQKELEGLYKYAYALVNGSLYEGFGLPPLEAMIRKIPVAISDIPVFKEVCEDTAIYFDPYNEKNIAEKIRLLLDDKHLRKKMIAKGLEKVKEYSWDKCARETFKVYEEVLRDFNKDK